MYRIYLDTKILIGKIIGSPSEKREYNQILIKIKKNYREIFIPQTVLGESFVKILEKSKSIEDDMIFFTKMINGLTDIKTQTPPLVRNILEMALDIQSKDEYNIGYCDAILVSHALCNTVDCAVFIIDKDVHQSTKIQNKLNECHHKVKLIDSI